MNTQDLSKFGYRELAMAGKLLLALADQKWQTPADTLGEKIHLEFNSNSGSVFLGDEDGQTVMLNDRGQLENWLFCGHCGNEGFRSEMVFSEDGERCEHCAKK